MDSSLNKVVIDDFIERAKKMNRDELEKFREKTVCNLISDGDFQTASEIFSLFN